MGESCPRSCLAAPLAIRIGRRVPAGNDERSRPLRSRGATDFVPTSILRGRVGNCQAVRVSSVRGFVADRPGGSGLVTRLRPLRESRIARR